MKSKKTAKKAAKKKAASAMGIPPRTEWLFVQIARQAELVPNASGKTGTLTLMGLQRTIQFSDRPVRKAKHETTEQFLKSWAKGPNSFAENPPNAELVIFNPGKPSSAVTLILTKPQIGLDKLIYKVKVVEEGVTLTEEGGSAVLFIDDKLSPRAKAAIRKKFKDGESIQDLANDYHVTEDTISAIL